MSVQPAVRIVSGKMSTLAYLFCVLLASSALHAEYPPGQIRLTPKVNLHLEPTPLRGSPPVPSISRPASRSNSSPTK